jgi:hypothetical protein
MMMEASTSTKSHLTSLPGGTTALHGYLQKHPDIRSPKVGIINKLPAKSFHTDKEINFFSSADWYYSGLGIYEKIISPQEENPNYHVCLADFDLSSR